MWPKLGLLPEKENTWVYSRAPLPQVQVTLARPAPDLDLQFTHVCYVCVCGGWGDRGNGWSLCVLPVLRDPQGLSCLLGRRRGLDTGL